MFDLATQNQVRAWTNEDNAGWMFYQIGNVSLDLHESGRVCVQVFGTLGECPIADLQELHALNAIFSHPDVQTWLRQRGYVVVPPARFPWAMVIAWMGLCIALAVLVVERSI